jgi:hypothetical protein
MCKKKAGKRSSKTNPTKSVKWISLTFEFFRVASCLLIKKRKFFVEKNESKLSEKKKVWTYFEVKTDERKYQ